MKNKKQLLVLMAFMMLTGCGQGNLKDEIDPILSGVLVEKTCKVNEEVNLLDGVSALDDIDGDITSKITITTLPYMEVVNGVIVPTLTGDYEICYEVSDLAGNLVKAYITLTVEPGMGEKELYKKVDIEQPTLNGWEITSKEGLVITQKALQDKYNLKVTKQEDEEFKLTKTFTVIEDATYSLLFNFDSNVEGTIVCNTLDQNIVVGNNNLEVDITEVINDGVVTIDFSKLSGDIDLKIAHIKVRSEKGVDSEKELIGEDYSFKQEGNVYADFGNESQGELVNEDNQVTMNITKGSLENNVWNTKLFVKTNQTLKAYVKYVVSIDVEAVSAIDLFEICYNSGSVEKGVGALYSLQVEANTKKTITFEVTPSEEKEDLILMFQLGKQNADVNGNSIVVSNLSIMEYGGDKDITSDDTLFAIEGINMFNEQTTGSLYLENEQIVYDVGTFGSVDWHNKLMIPNVSLEDSKMYTFEFKIRASEDIKGCFIVNDPTNTSWNPLINHTYQVSTSETTISITASDVVLMEESFELMWQFGGEENKEKQNVQIYISNIEIYSQDYIR